MDAENAAMLHYVAGCKPSSLFALNDAVGVVTNSAITIHKLLTNHGGQNNKSNDKNIVCHRVLSYVVNDTETSSIFVGHEDADGSCRITQHHTGIHIREGVHIDTGMRRPIHLSLTSSPDGQIIYLLALFDVDGLVSSCETVVLYTIAPDEETGMPTVMEVAHLDLPEAPLSLDVLNPDPSAPLSKFAGIHICPVDPNWGVIVSSTELLVLQKRRLADIEDTFEVHSIIATEGETFTGVGAYVANGYGFVAATSTGLAYATAGMGPRRRSGESRQTKSSATKSRKSSRKATKHAVAKQETAVAEFKPTLTVIETTEGTAPVDIVCPGNVLVVYPNRVVQYAIHAAHDTAELTGASRFSSIDVTALADSPDCVLEAITAPATLSPIDRRHIVSVYCPKTNMVAFASVDADNVQAEVADRIQARIPVGIPVDSDIIRFPDGATGTRHPELHVTVWQTGLLSAFDTVSGHYSLIEPLVDSTDTPIRPTCMAVCPAVNGVAIGDDTGIVRIYHFRTAEPDEPGTRVNLAFAQRMFDGPVASLSCSVDGFFLAATTKSSPHVAFIKFIADPKEPPSLQYARFVGLAQFSVADEPASTPSLQWAMGKRRVGDRAFEWRRFLYVGVTNTTIWRLQVQDDLHAGSDGFTISVTEITRTELRTGAPFTAFAVAPKCTTSPGDNGAKVVDPDEVYVLHADSLAVYNFATVHTGTSLFETRNAPTEAVRTEPLPAPPSTLCVLPRIEGTIIAIGLSSGAVALVVGNQHAVEISGSHCATCGAVQAVAINTARENEHSSLNYLISTGADGVILVRTMDELLLRFDSINSTHCASSMAASFHVMHDDNQLGQLAVDAQPAPEFIQESAELISPAKEFELGRMSATREAHERMANELRQEVGEIRVAVEALIEENTAREEMDRVDLDKFTIDVELAKSIEHDNAKAVATTHDECEAWVNVRAAITSAIHADTVGTHVPVDHATEVTGLAAPVAVESFTLPKWDKTREAQVTAIRHLRAIELATQQQVRLESSVVDTEEKEAADDEDQGAVELPEVEECLYEPLELFTTSRRVAQTRMLEACIRKQQLAFNSRFVETLHDKRATIDKLNSKESRIAQIVVEIHELQSKLQVPKTPFRLPSATFNETGTVKVDKFAVDPSEVTVERVFSEAEKAELAAKEAAEQARLAAMAADKAAIRALGDMMGGSLEVQEADELDALERPDAFDVAEADRTDEQVAAIKAYNTQVKKIAEERSKRVKGLEGEMKRSKEQVVELADAFDAKLAALAIDKANTTRACAILQLQVIELAGLYLQEVAVTQLEAQLELDIADTTKALETAQTLQDTLSGRVEEEKARAAEIAQNSRGPAKRKPRIIGEYQDIVAAMTPELSAAVINALSDMVGRRPSPEALYAQLAGPSGDSGHTQPLDTRPRAVVHETDSWDSPRFADKFAPTPADIKLLNELKPTEQGAADGFDNGAVEDAITAMWRNALGLRAEIALADARNHQQKLVHADVVDASSRVAARVGEISTRRESLEQRKVDLAAQHRSAIFDNLIVVELQQGQVEVPRNPVATDYSSAVMLSKSTIDGYNSTIAKLAQEHCDALIRVRDTRSACNNIVWEKQYRQLEIDDVQAQTSDLQLFRVRREMRELLHAKDAESIHRKQVEILTKQLSHMKSDHAKSLKSMQANVASYQRKTSRFDKTTREMEMTIDALTKKMEQWNRLYAVLHRAKTDAAPKGPTAAARRKKQEDAIKAQKAAANVLTAEVERLRRKTFPSFAAVGHRADTY
ncbi:Chromosome partition protein Smc [Carpediemonas membranifera]|uniref:Chromosome partition protein Smc n=1 Tax=Carpediemonas membranifera TaxID=201153 RepID=A0A8J6AUH4_9EUKA|nr:Chromosome partition protein Smc [Carpediemonas membranifera]|eukprot:KAG9391890.1 Chromosome partition protein Smc [Carpediemonas membranifera]